MPRINTNDDMEIGDFSLIHVPREQNRDADRLATTAIKEARKANPAE